ncbi:S1 RNA-binding domain-containing protein [Abyssisolibacter fermentans]|uniref:CvfB family protein n=1 Tax=Abyssisolibacter fermentans TaxID=1766203 RepID=UPI00082FBDE8|nr:S1-like domain-containing RNA-binding protein [Abyssisolibacter fermentans]
MIELGKIQKLQVIDFGSKGVYLSEGKKENNKILLHNNEIKNQLKIGDEIEVFVYRNTSNKIVATTNRPKLTVGEIGFLKVIEITKFGAFLDWGLDKDLFLPFKEQKDKIVQGREYLVGVYIDKSSRLCATMNVYDLLSTESPYKVNDSVKGFVYKLNREMGAFVAIDYRYHAMIPNNELFGDIRIGDNIEGRVTKIRPDGKMYISIRQKTYKQIDKDVNIIMDKLLKNKGKLYLNDNSSPEKIRQQLNISKGAFKKAVGRLLKKRIIRITKDGIELIV